MELVFKAFKQVGEKMGASSDWLWCVNWVLESTRVRSFDFISCLGHDPQRYKAMQGMFFGTRATDIYNNMASEVVLIRWKRSYRERFNVRCKKKLRFRVQLTPVPKRPRRPVTPNGTEQNPADVTPAQTRPADVPTQAALLM